MLKKTDLYQEEKEKSKSDEMKIKSITESSTLLSESIFCLLFSPTTPIIFDSSGLLSEFIKNVLSEHNFCLDYFEKDSTTLHSVTRAPSVEENKIISDTYDSVDVEREKLPTNDVICLHDLNVTLQDKNLENYAQKALKAHWAPILHKL